MGLLRTRQNLLHQCLEPQFKSSLDHDRSPSHPQTAWTWESSPDSVLCISCTASFASAYSYFSRLRLDYRSRYQGIQCRRNLMQLQPMAWSNHKGTCTCFWCPRFSSLSLYPWWRDKFRPLTRSKKSWVQTDARASWRQGASPCLASTWRPHRSRGLSKWLHSCDFGACRLEHRALSWPQIRLSPLRRPSILDLLVDFPLRAKSDKGGTREGMALYDHACSATRCPSGHRYTCISTELLRTFDDFAKSKHREPCRALRTPWLGSCASIRALQGGLFCLQARHVIHCLSQIGRSKAQSLSIANRKCRARFERAIFSSVQLALPLMSALFPFQSQWIRAPQC